MRSADIWRADRVEHGQLTTMKQREQRRHGGVKRELTIEIQAGLADQLGGSGRDVGAEPVVFGLGIGKHRREPVQRPRQEDIHERPEPGRPCFGEGRGQQGAKQGSTGHHLR